jgi:predicted nucleotidyltransferase
LAATLGGVVGDSATPAAQRLRELLAMNAEAIYELAHAAGVSSVSVIGSVARGDATAESDIDLLIRADDEVTLLDLIRLRKRLVAMLGVRVDLFEPSWPMTDIAALEGEARPLCP